MPKKLNIINTPGIDLFNEFINPFVIIAKGFFCPNLLSTSLIGIGFNCCLFAMEEKLGSVFFRSYFSTIQPLNQSTLLYF